MDLANDTKKIAQVFPLMNKQTVSYRIKEQSPSSKEQSISDEKENEINNEPGPSELLQSQNQSRIQNQEWNIIENRMQSQENIPEWVQSKNQNQDWIQSQSQEWNLKQNWDWNQNQSWNENQRTLPKLSSITLKPEHEQHPAYYNRSGSFNVQCPSPLPQPQSLPVSQAIPQPPPSPFLKVQQIHSRTHSAELLIPMDQEDFRRSSFDNSPGFRRPGTGRKLPSTEHLEKPITFKVGLFFLVCKM